MQCSFSSIKCANIWHPTMQKQFLMSSFNIEKCTSTSDAPNSRSSGSKKEKKKESTSEIRNDKNTKKLSAT